jgi:hypothetical protein
MNADCRDDDHPELVSELIANYSNQAKPHDCAKISAQLTTSTLQGVRVNYCANT